MGKYKAEKNAQGRLKGQKPVAVLDIGSNSIRMVIYEYHSRALTPLYNEKSACSLGQGVAKTGMLEEKNITKALKTMRRFALVIKLMKVSQVYCVATSAVREAKNGLEFTKNVEEITGVKVQILSGEEEANYAALGAIAGIAEFNSGGAIVADLGGGSLELATVNNAKIVSGETYKLGVIRLAEQSDFSIKRAKAIAKQILQGANAINVGEIDVFCAIGGSWRALAKLHQQMKNYPLHMIQNYEISAFEMIDFCENLLDEFLEVNSYSGADFVSLARRNLLPFGVLVLQEILILGKFKTIVFSTLGVREGYLFSLLDESEQKLDPLLVLSEEISTLRSRSPKHSKELIEFSEKFYSATSVSLSKQDVRLNKAACLLSDIGWRGHPDYRGNQSVDLVAYGALVGINHAGRAFLALTLAYRYMGLKQKSFSTDLINICKVSGVKNAQILGAIMRVAFPLSAGMSGVLPKIEFATNEKILTLILPKELEFLEGARLNSRLAQLANVAGFTSYQVVIAQ